MQTKATGPRNEPDKPQVRVDTLWEPREASCVPSPKPSPPSAGRRILLAFLPETLNRVDGFLLRDNGPQSQDASSTPRPDQAVLSPTPPPPPPLQKQKVRPQGPQPPRLTLCLGGGSPSVSLQPFPPQKAGTRQLTVCRE